MIEAALEIDSDMPPGITLEHLFERAGGAFGEEYPVARKHGVQGLQFSREEGREMIQVRTQGFSFNRLAPCSRLEDYMPDIERAYTLYRETVQPVQIYRIGFRCIHRIRLPLKDGAVELNQYLEAAPRVPEEENSGRFGMRGFLHHDVFAERESGNQANRVLSLGPAEMHYLPLLFENAASRFEKLPPEEWRGIREVVTELKSLNDEVFADTLTKECLQLFL